MRLAVSFGIGSTAIAINQYVQYGDVNSLAKSISQNFTKSALIIWGTTAATYGLSYGLGQINCGF